MQQIEPDSDSFATARREFLAKCGRLAVVTPPTVTLMLAASRQNFAVAQSGGNPEFRRRDRDGDGDDDHDHTKLKQGNNGFGNGGNDGVPGRSRHEDRDR